MTRTSRNRRVPFSLGVGAVALVLAVVIALWGAKIAETSAAALLASIGTITSIGLPISAVVGSTSAALALGGTILAGWLIPVTDGGDDSDKQWAVLARRRILSITVGISVVWTLAAIVQLLLSYSLSSGQAVDSPRFGSDIGIYMVSDLGVWMLWGAILAGLTSAAALAGDSVGVARLSAIVALAGVMARAMTGHAAGDASHESATSSMFLHLVAVSAWVGPLMLLQLLPNIPNKKAIASFRTTVRRYSAVALAAWVMLLFSGAIALYSRVTTLDQVLSHPYGQLGLIKTVLLLVLGVLGAMQRSIIARTSASARRAFARVALLEIVLMGAAIGLGAAMSSSPPPAENIPPPPSAAGILTTYPLPPDPAGIEGVLQWRLDVFAVAASVIVLWWAFASKRVSLKRGGSGWALIGAAVAYAVLTSSPLVVYSRVLLSAHLLLSVAVMVCAGFPLSQLVPERYVRRIGAWSLWGWVLASAVPGGLLALGYLPAPVLRRILESHPANVGFVLSCIAAGTLWGVLIRAWPHHRRGLVWSFIPLIPMAVFLLCVGCTTAVLAPSWFGATGRTWMARAVTDQSVGASLAGLVVCVAFGLYFLVVSKEQGTDIDAPLATQRNVLPVKKKV